ncbi:MAG: hypothetical protein SFW36_16385 [Leptolyngbyaceae cyanobacterium bins.59]|nr:hypothetical protein [Leptolyngbyaceae cyanobacterium bins.59]
MLQTAQGIPNLPDLTHPDELMKLGSQMLSLLWLVFLAIGLLGLAIALFGFALRRDSDDRSFVQEWVGRYSQLLRGLLHALLILVLLTAGFFVSSTLANRYHHWEQARIAKVTATVAGDRLEQMAPQVRYEIEEPYTYDTQVDGKIVPVTRTRKVPRFLTLARSQIQVKLDQATDPATERTIYKSDFSGDFTVVNRLSEAKTFFFEVQPPAGYSLLQSFKVERDGAQLQPINPGDYGFPLKLEPGAATSLRVTYQAQGGPRWVYNSNGQLLNNFRLSVHADFPKADFASGIVPSSTQAKNRGTVFIWEFNENVSVLNPFGVFTSIGPIRNTGILPRLLLLAPLVCLGWLLLLYLSVPLTLRNVTIAVGLFFTCLLALTYLSRVMDARLAWGGISLFLMVMSAGLGKERSLSLSAVICTIAGVALPVLGLLVPYSGLTLSLAGLLSVGWLVVRNWYGASAIEMRMSRP